MNKAFSKKDIVRTIYMEGSFSKASKILFMSQPALSAIVRQVEEEIGLPLIDRSCKPLQMTEVGMEYIRAAEQITGVEESFRNYVYEISNLNMGSLRVGCNQLLSVLVVPGYISRFISEHPKLDIQLTNASSPILESMLTSGSLDLVIDSKPLSDEHFEGRFFFKEHLVLAVPAALHINERLKAYALSREDILNDKHMDSGTDPVDVSIMGDVPFLRMTKDNDTRYRSDLIFQAAGIRPPVPLEVDRLITMYNYIRLGTAAGIVTDTLIKNSQDCCGANVVYYKLSGDMITRDVYLYCKRNKYRSPAMEAFTELLCGKAE